jgi:hypothetical protein
MNLRIGRKDTLNDTEASLQVSTHDANAVTSSQSQCIDGIVCLLKEGGRNAWIILEAKELVAGW